MSKEIEILVPRALPVMRCVSLCLFVGACGTKSNGVKRDQILCRKRPTIVCVSLCLFVGACGTKPNGVKRDLMSCPKRLISCACLFVFLSVHVERNLMVSTET